MPIQYQKDRNGQWKAVGVASRDEMEPRELTPGSADDQRAKGFGRAVGTKATLKGKPVIWAGPDLGWQSPGSFEKAKSQGKLPKPQPSQPVNKRQGLSWLMNEAQWLYGSAAKNAYDTFTKGPSLGQSLLGPGAGLAVTAMIGRQNMGSLLAGTQNNVLKSVEAGLQWLGGKEVNPGQARWMQGMTDTAYRVLGAKPPSEQTPKELETDATWRSVGVNAAVSAAMIPLAPFGVGATVGGTALRSGGLFLGEQVLSTALDDNTQGNPSNLIEGLTGKQVPFAVRPEDDWGEATRKSLIPNTVLAALPGAALGALGKTAGLLPDGGSSFQFTKRWTRENRSVGEVNQARAWALEKGLITEGENGFANRYSPPDSISDVSVTAERPAAVVPDRGAEAAVSGDGLAGEWQPNSDPLGPIGIEGRPAPVQGDVQLEGPDPQAAPAAAPAAPVAEGGARIVGRPDPYSPLQENLRQREAALNPDTAAYEGWLQDRAALSGQLPRWEVEAGDPWVDPATFNPVADPSKIETDQLVRDLWNLDDQSLVDLSQSQGSVVEGVQQAVGLRQSFDPAGDPRFAESAVANATAPGEALGLQGTGSYRSYLESEDWDGLRALTDPENNPAAARIIESNTGRRPDEWTKADMVDGLTELADRDNRFVIPRPNGELYRSGEVVLPVEDLGIDPKRFQFKGGVDPTTGEQLGQSLEGVGAWNTDLEGTVSAWRDPADGLLWTINGHNRVAAAKRLGVPSLPVKVYDAPDAKGARAIGAAQNIATGQGTPIDAAKFLRDSGISDLSQLQELVPGMPLKSGWAEQGLALSKLPDEVFNAVVRGDLSPARGAVIGGSGRTPQEMVSLWRYAERQNFSDRVLKELVAMTAPDATATAPAMKQASIWDVLGQDSPEAEAFNTGLLTKARLSDRVGALLKADRKLFAAVSKRGAADRLQAGAANTIDAAGSQAVADQASRVIDIYDRLKYQAGPIGDLLNDGVIRLEAGEAIDAVTKDIASQVADAMEKSMGGLDAAAPTAARTTAAMPTVEEVAKAEANLLSPRKLENRRAKVEELAAKDGLTAAERKALTTARRELRRHTEAEEVLQRQRMAEEAGPAAVEAPAAPQPEAPQGPVRLDPQQREQLQVELAQRAIDNDEVRPPATEAPTLFDGPVLPLERSLDSIERNGISVGSDGAQAIADEIRLGAEYSYRDAAMAQAAKEAEREATGYYELDGGSRLKSGQFREGFRDAPIGDSLDARAAYAREQRIAAEKANDTTLAREWGNAERMLERQRVTEALQRMGVSQEEMFSAGLFDDSAPLLNQNNKAINPEVLPPASETPIADGLRATLDRIAQSDARMARRIGEYIDTTKDGLEALKASLEPAPPAKPRKLKASPEGLVPEDQAKPLSPFGPMDLANRQVDMPVVEFSLPPTLAKASPRYGRFELKFESDLDKTAYMLARDATSGASKSAQKFRSALDAVGLDPAEVARYGRDKVQPAVKAAAARGSTDGLPLGVPDQGFQGSTRLPKVERLRLENEMAALDAEILALDAEIAKTTKKALDGGCL